MKGAILDWITSKLDRIGVATRLGYTTRYEMGDLDDDDLVTKYLLENFAGGSLPTPPDPVSITAGTDDTPMVVAYVGGSSTSYTLKRLSDGTFDWNTGVVFDGSNFTINGDDNGSGKFADSFIFSIKP